MARTSAALLLLLGMSSVGAGWTLVDNFSGSSFLSNFNFFTGADPTNGFVKYVDAGTAASTGLTGLTSSGAVYIGVDHSNVTPNGRPSVRITSKKAYNHGLFIADFTHMPGGICGTWPAYWLLGPNWPSSGEIDIIEGVNQQANDYMTLHTSDSCTIGSTGFYGSLMTSNCYVNAAGQAANAGCGISNPDTRSYGSAFNSVGGAVYAVEWTSDHINVWFFSRQTGIPQDILDNAPNPSLWPTPAAHFQGSCNIDAHFKNMNIVFDNTFCGDWAGSVWASSGCTSRDASCNSFVANNPSAFNDAYWAINYVKVYQ